MFDQLRIKAVPLRQRELEHDQLTCRELAELCEEGCFQQRLGAGFVWTTDVHFRLDDRHQARRENLRGELELLIDNSVDTGGARLFDDRAHLGSEDALRV